MWGSRPGVPTPSQAWSTSVAPGPLPSSQRSPGLRPAPTSHSPGTSAVQAQETMFPEEPLTMGRTQKLCNFPRGKERKGPTRVCLYVHRPTNMCTHTHHMYHICTLAGFTPSFIYTHTFVDFHTCLFTQAHIKHSFPQAPIAHITPIHIPMLRCMYRLCTPNTNRHAYLIHSYGLT